MTKHLDEEAKQSRLRYDAVEAQCKRWKERVSEEQGVQKSLAKDISDLKYELSELSQKHLADERVLEELRADLEIN